MSATSLMLPAVDKASHFELLTAFEIAAPRKRVYGAIREVGQWPSWWRGCLKVEELAPGDEHSVGARRRVLWRSRLPYDVEIEVEVTAITRAERIEVASRGDLDGKGTWTFADTATGTRVEYLWEVALRKRWMQRLAPLLRPLFKLNHDWLMANGVRGLAQHLGTPPPSTLR